MQAIVTCQQTVVIMQQLGLQQLLHKWVSHIDYNYIALNTIMQLQPKKQNVVSSMLLFITNFIILSLFETEKCT